MTTFSIRNSLKFTSKFWLRSNLQAQTLPGIPKRQLRPRSGERGDEQRGVHVPLPRLRADRAREDQRRRARLLHQVRRGVRQPGLQRGVRQLPVGADAGLYC